MTPRKKKDDEEPRADETQEHELGDDFLEDVDDRDAEEEELGVLGRGKEGPLPRVDGRSPLLGEHTDEVLTELGFSKDQIATLRAEKAI